MKSIVSFVVGLSFLSLAACAVSPEQEDGSQQAESAEADSNPRVVTHMSRPTQGDERPAVRETLPESNGGEHMIEREVRPEPNAMRAEDQAPLSPHAAKLEARPFSVTSEIR